MAVNKFDNSMFDAGTIGTSANQLLQLDGSTKIPAVDGSLLTSIPSSFTIDPSNDPVISTNPPGGAGTIWINKTSGEAWCCTDETAGANVWKNLGSGSSHLLPYDPRTSNYGYVLGGSMVGAPYYNTNTIQRWSYTADTGGQDIGDLVAEPDVYNNNSPPGNMGKGLRYYGGANYSPTYGYAIGGNIVQQGAPPGAQYGIGATKRREKFAFAASVTSTEVTNLLNFVTSMGGTNSETDGYIVGGGLEANNAPNYSYIAPTTAYTGVNHIDKFSFASDGASVDTGADLTIARVFPCGASSGTHGYAISGAVTGPPYLYSTVIDKHSFASTVINADHGDLVTGTQGCSASYSDTYGFVSGGSAPWTDRIERFAFASNVTAGDWGNLSRPCGWFAAAGASTQGYAYTAGSYDASWNRDTKIDKYAHASNAGSTYTADLTGGGIVSANTGGICQS